MHNGVLMSLDGIIAEPRGNELFELLKTLDLAMRNLVLWEHNHFKSHFLTEIVMSSERLKEKYGPLQAADRYTRRNESYKYYNLIKCLVNLRKTLYDSGREELVNLLYTFENMMWLTDATIEKGKRAEPRINGERTLLIAIIQYASLLSFIFKACEDECLDFSVYEDLIIVYTDISRKIRCGTWKKDAATVERCSRYVDIAIRECLEAEIEPESLYMFGF